MKQMECMPSVTCNRYGGKYIEYKLDSRLTYL